MKKNVLFLVTAVCLSATSALAANHSHTSMNLDECIRHCVQQSETIDQKIVRLEQQIATGRTSYSADDLRKLEIKLEEANYMLDSLTRP